MKENTKSSKGMLYAEFGKYSLDISKLVFGGVILAGVMKLDVNRTALFVIGTIIVLFTAIAGFAFIALSNSKN